MNKKIIFVLVDINSKTDLKKITSVDNEMEYKFLCKVCSESIENLIGEAFINYENNIYVNLFCFNNNKFNIKYLEKSFNYITPQINKINKKEIIIRQNFEPLKKFLKERGINFKYEKIGFETN